VIHKISSVLAYWSLLKDY